MPVSRKALLESVGADLSGMEVKDAKATVLSSDDATGTFEALVSVTNIPDHGNDIIEPGAYEQTIKARPHPRLLRGHDWGRRAGKVLAMEEWKPGDWRLPQDLKSAGAGALWIKGQYNLGTREGQEAYSDLKFDPDNAEFCVDTATEILTGRGWLSYDEVTVDDEAYQVDLDSLTARFDRIEAVNVWPEKQRTLRLIETGGFSALSTLNHRWPVWQKIQSKARGTYYRLRERRTDELNATHSLIRAVPPGDAPVEPKWSDGFVETVAWFWTEGWWVAGRTAMIGQSATANPMKVIEIRRALKESFGLSEFSERSRPDGMVYWRLKAGPSAAVRQVTEAHKMPTVDFLRSLTLAQRRLFIDRCLDGDGHRRNSPDGSFRRWNQTEQASVDRFEMVCALAGIATHSYRGWAAPDGHARFGDRPTINVSLLASSLVKPLDAIRVAKHQAAHRNVGPARVADRHRDELVEHTGIVWCPTTVTGTWLARRNGTVTWSMNSIGYDCSATKGAGPRAFRDPKTGYRHIKSLDLFECSDVVVGMASGTRALCVKALNAGMLDQSRQYSLGELVGIVTGAKAASDNAGLNTGTVGSVSEPGALGDGVEVGGDEDEAPAGGDRTTAAGEDAFLDDKSAARLSVKDWIALDRYFTRKAAGDGQSNWEQWDEEHPDRDRGDGSGGRAAGQTGGGVPAPPGPPKAPGEEDDQKPGGSNGGGSGAGSGDGGGGGGGGGGHPEGGGGGESSPVGGLLDQAHELIDAVREGAEEGRERGREWAEHLGEARPGVTPFGKMLPVVTLKEMGVDTDDDDDGDGDGRVDRAGSEGRHHVLEPEDVNLGGGRTDRSAMKGIRLDPLLPHAQVKGRAD